MNSNNNVNSKENSPLKKCSSLADEITPKMNDKNNEG